MVSFGETSFDSIFLQQLCVEVHVGATQALQKLYLNCISGVSNVVMA